MSPRPAATRATRRRSDGGAMISSFGSPPKPLFSSSVALHNSTRETGCPSLDRHLAPKNVRHAPYIRVRRRLRHLPLLGELLAGVDARARPIPALPGGSGGIPPDSPRNGSPRRPP